jgi:glycosyltransferase involved in cell wall biosynthesis
MRYLAFAYACEPAEGSEPGAGWMWARMLARSAETWVVTRANNRQAIEAMLPSIPERERLHFVYVDLPASLRRWKRGTRGLHAYYLLWQVAAVREAQRVHRAVGFDLIWHVTLANAWLGSAAWLLGPPFVLGPVGGGVGPPWRLVPSMGVRPTAYETSRAIARAAGRYLNPLARIAWSRAARILVQNRETVDWLPRRHRHKTRVFPHVVLAELPAPAGPRAGERPRTALFAGRLLPWKGVDLAIAAVSRLPDWRLVICGRGPDEPRLRRIVRETNVTDRVVFKGWLSRSEVLRSMREEAGIFLFPSLHDEAGWVIVEALAAELPVVCLDHGGPPLLADGHGVGVTVSGSRGEIVERRAAGLDRARSMPMTGARASAARYQIDQRSEDLRDLYELESRAV